MLNLDKNRRGTSRQPTCGISDPFNILAIGAGEGLRASLQKEHLACIPGACVSHARTIESAIENGGVDDVPDVLVLNMSLRHPSKDTLSMARRSFDATPIILISHHADWLCRDETYRRTIIRIAPEDVSQDGILHALIAAMVSKIRNLNLALRLRDASSSSILVMERVTRLTPRQIDVMFGIRQGKSNKIISCELGITVRTVKAHATEIFRKLEVGDRSQLIAKTAWAEDRGRTRGACDREIATGYASSNFMASASRHMCSLFHVADNCPSIGQYRRRSSE